MGVSNAVDWWEEWQLRILVLGSLGIQWILFLSSSQRKHRIPSLFRSVIWLTYLGSDAVAIYGLATLFNRQKKQDYSSANSKSILEVVWAPVLLMHLGGQDRITAYNIEDNELWTRHVLTAVSQITVAIYVFCKSWPGQGGDTRLLQASILFFVPGILKCIEKPLALKSASFNSLVSLSDRYLHPEKMTSSVARFMQLVAPNRKRMEPSEGLHPGMASRGGKQRWIDYLLPLRTIEATSPPRMANRTCKDISLEDYVQKAKALVLAKCHPRDGAEGDTIDLEHNQAQGETNEVYLEPSHHRQPHEKACANEFKPNQAPRSTWWWRLLPMVCLSESRAAKEMERRKEMERFRDEELERRRLDLASRKLFVDLASSYPDRLSILETFLVQDVHKSAYASLQKGLFETFDLIYTKIKMKRNSEMSILEIIGFYTRLTATYLPFAAIGLFHKSNREAYNVYDVKVTYALFCCTAVLEMFALPFVSDSEPTVSDSEATVRDLEPTLSGKVAQYSLVGFFVRSKKHSMTMGILSIFNCKDFLDQRCCMKSRSSSSRITELVLRHVKGWWKEHIVNAASYRRFSNHRGQWSIKQTGRDQDLKWSLNRPFDESVLLWHIATDLCIYKNAVCHENATVCREISNYMIYLLFVNPEMLLSGTRRNLFMEANAELEEILMDDHPSLNKILEGEKPSLWETLKGNKSFSEFLKGKGPSPEEIERGFVQKIIDKLQPTENPAHAEESPTDTEHCQAAHEGFIQEAWKIFEVLLDLGDENMWKVIEGVWVEMLCFSASRCRGYLHAKSMGSGLDLLTYIWSLLWRMGMETLPERLQRTELSGGGVGGTTEETIV